MKNAKLYAAFSTLALGITLLVNTLANVLPINGLNTGEVSALYPSLFTPAAITFLIWSVIYLLLMGFVIYQWVCAVKNYNHAIFQSLTPLFVISCILNGGWILAWHYLHVGLSVMIMIALLVTLVRMFLMLRKFEIHNRADQYLIHLPFTIYLAWICVATIANISALLVSLHWNGGFFSPETWTVIMMGVAVAIAYIMTTRYSAPAFSMVIMWALAGIFIKWNAAGYIMIVGASVVLFAVLLIVVLYTLFKKSENI